MLLNRQDGLDWISAGEDNLRWATDDDLTGILEIFGRMFPFHEDPVVQRTMWEAKIRCRLLVIAEHDGKLSGFMEIVMGRDPWRPPAGLAMRRWMREWLARKVVCHPAYSKDGPYILFIARHPDAPRGTGAEMVRALQRHHAAVSLLGSRHSDRMRRYYRELGFAAERAPVSFLLRAYIDRVYVFFIWRLEQTGV